MEAKPEWAGLLCGVDTGGEGDSGHGGLADDASPRAGADICGRVKLLEETGGYCAVPIRMFNR